MAPDLDLSGFPWMPLDTSITSSDLCERAPAEAFRAAVTLWCLSWRQVPASSLPGDEKRIAALIGLSPQKWKAIREHAMAGFVLCADGRFYHSLIAEQALACAKKSESQRSRSKAYWGRKKQGELLGDTLGISQAGGSSNNLSSKSPSLPFVLPSWIEPEVWKAFEDHRRTKRAPMTDRARELIVIELEKLDPSHGAARRIIEQSIRRGWQDVFPLKDDGARGGSGLAARNADVADRFARGSGS